MTPREKAQAGLWLIQQAILQLIREHGPMQPHVVSDELGLRRQLPEGVNLEGIGYHVMLAMASTGQLVKEPGSHPRYSIGPAPVGVGTEWEL